MNILCVYHELLGKLKSEMVLTTVSSTFLPYVWGFENIFAKTNHSFYFSIGSLMSLTVYIYILTKALLVFIILLKMVYVGLMVGKLKHALVSHISQNQTKDSCRCQIKHVDQDCAHVWKVDDGNRILLFMNLSPFYLDNMRTWQYDYFFHGH